MPKKQLIDLHIKLTLEKSGEDLSLVSCTVEGEDIPIEIEEDQYEDLQTEPETILGVDKTTALAVGMGMLGVGQDK